MRRKQGKKQLEPTESKRSWPLVPFAIALSSGLLLWAAFPPLGLSWLGWLVPLPWLYLVREPQDVSFGRRYWLLLWMAGTIGWLILLEGIRRAHFANNFGLLALSLYLGTYCPAFIAATRVAVHRNRVPLVIAAPVAWAGLEFIRGYLFTGFSMGLLAHTQSEFPIVIQIADLGGAYTVSFLMVLVAAAVLQLFPRGGEPRRYLPAAFATAMVAAACAYAVVRMQSAPPLTTEPQLKVALLQGTRDKIFRFDPELNEQTWVQYSRLMQRAKTEQPDVDLIVWPEATFTSKSPEIFVEGSLVSPDEARMKSDLYTQTVRRHSLQFTERARWAAAQVNPMPTDGQPAHETLQLLGAETAEFAGASMRNFNSALLLDAHGEIRDRYYKCHAVMFGEYIPFGSIFPWIYSLTPMRQGMSIGDGPRLFEVKGFRVTPNVCFEITVPHLLRRGYMAFAGHGKAAPDVIVNVSDDGWFWGSTVLDLQLACAVFRAVEVRRPVLIAANTGISASIDSNGRILARSMKRQEDIIYANVVHDSRSTVYCWWGDLPAMLCFGVTVVWLARAWFLKKPAAEKAVV